VLCVDAYENKRGGGGGGGEGGGSGIKKKKRWQRQFFLLKEEDDTYKKIRLSEQSCISERKVHVFKCETLVHQINTYNMKYKKRGCLLTRKEVMRALLFSKENRIDNSACWDMHPQKKKKTFLRNEVSYNLSAG